jgi:DNA-binding XRE family transcriptional regulator
MKTNRKTTRILCAECGEGRLISKSIRHDVGALLGMKSVDVQNLPALVCNRCGAVSVPGAILDKLQLFLAATILQRPTLGGYEVRYLRRMLGDTQEELATSLAVDRATVNRWENLEKLVEGTQAYAIRSHAFFRLRRLSPVIESVADVFAERKPPRSRKPASYQFDATRLRAAAL